MMKLPSLQQVVIGGVLAWAVPVFAAERAIMMPRVPPDQRDAARALSNPLPASPETVARGKGIYEGKGGCVNCHGITGDGLEPVAASLDPSPRDFHHHGFWRHRTDGELFWVIKHGIPETAMAGVGSILSDDEIWSVLEYLRTFDRAGGHGRMGPPHGMRRMEKPGEPADRRCCPMEDR